MSKELFLCGRTPKSLLVKVNKAKEMPLLSRNCKIQYPTNKLIPYKSPALCKTQPNLLENCAHWNSKEETVPENRCFMQKLQENFL